MNKPVDISQLHPKTLAMLFYKARKLTALESALWEVISRISCYDEFTKSCMICNSPDNDLHDKTCSWAKILDILDDD